MRCQIGIKGEDSMKKMTRKHSSATTLAAMAGGATLALALLLAAPAAWAHAYEKATLPERDSTVAESPEKIGIHFEGGSMRITRFELSGAQGTVPLADEPGSQFTKVFELRPAETLAPGDYEVSWRGVSDDGHAMSGGFGFTVGD